MHHRMPSRANVMELKCGTMEWERVVTALLWYFFIFIWDYRVKRNRVNDQIMFYLPQVYLEPGLFFYLPNIRYNLCLCCSRLNASSMLPPCLYSTIKKSELLQSQKDMMIVMLLPSLLFLQVFHMKTSTSSKCTHLSFPVRHFTVEMSFIEGHITAIQRGRNYFMLLYKQVSGS